MIAATVEAMYALSEENRFLEVTYANGDKEVLYFKDFSSGAMIESVVRRAKKLALKRYIGRGEKGIMADDLLTAVREEFKENEDLPNTTNPDDWAKIAGRRASGSSTSSRSWARRRKSFGASSASSTRASICKEARDAQRVPYRSVGNGGASNRPPFPPRVPK